MPRSEPLRAAEQGGIYAAEDVNLERYPFQALVGRALEHLRVLGENRALRAEASNALMPAGARESMNEGGRGTQFPLLRFPRVFRRFENTDALVNNVVESLADAAMVARVGMFSRRHEGEAFRLLAGLRCLPESYELEYHARDPLVGWLERNAHLVCRAHLPQIRDFAQREMLRRALDTVGAEVIVPLHARGRISGWLFFGHRLTGQTFDYQALESLMILGDHVSTVVGKRPSPRGGRTPENAR